MRQKPEACLVGVKNFCVLKNLGGTDDNLILCIKKYHCVEYDNYTMNIICEK